jgi:hypothetical protein
MKLTVPITLTLATTTTLAAPLKNIINVGDHKPTPTSTIPTTDAVAEAMKAAATAAALEAATADVAEDAVDDAMRAATAAAAMRVAADAAFNKAAAAMVAEGVIPGTKPTVTERDGWDKFRLGTPVPWEYGSNCWGC